MGYSVVDADELEAGGPEAPSGSCAALSASRRSISVGAHPGSYEHARPL